MIGRTVGQYKIERELGRGGMGAVYIGVHAVLGRRSAIKVLLPEMSSNRDVVQRFFNEAKAATAIKHPGIVDVYDYGLGDDGSAYIVMEVLDGESLASRLKRCGNVSPEFAVAIARQVAGSLAAAHHAGIIHRDLKPDNVFLVADPEVRIGERVKLLDFGIAKLVSPEGNMALTQTGALMGTPYYMSPEQCRGAGLVDARSDLYSLGCMMFEMLSGLVPFQGGGLGEIIAAHIHVAAPRLASIVPGVTPELDELVGRLLAKDPDDRPASAEAVAIELGALSRIGNVALAAVPDPATSSTAGTSPGIASSTVRSSPSHEVAVAAPTPVKDAAVVVPRPRNRVLVIGLVGVAIVVFYLAMWLSM